MPGLFAAVLHPDASSFLTECAKQDRFPEVRLSPGTGGLFSVAERVTREENLRLPETGCVRLAALEWLSGKGGKTEG